MKKYFAYFLLFLLSGLGVGYWLAKAQLFRIIGKPQWQPNWLGWLQDTLDVRDIVYQVEDPNIELPATVDLSPQMPEVYNQMTAGSCVACALAASFEYAKIKKGKKFEPSILFIYYNARKAIAMEAKDSGCRPRDAIKAIAKEGVCNTLLWNYDLAKVTEKPVEACYNTALSNQVVEYGRIPRDLLSMKASLSNGYPFSCALMVFDSFYETPASGVVELPAETEAFRGGHAVLCVGYDDRSQRFLMRNSWGKDWGNNGYFTLPYDYLMQAGLSEDFWSIRFVEQGAKKTIPTA